MAVAEAAATAAWCRTTSGRVFGGDGGRLHMWWSTVSRVAGARYWVVCAELRQSPGGCRPPRSLVDFGACVTDF
ncbi:hypothetical protein Dimus_001458 [Dionaea muscipula]